MRGGEGAGQADRHARQLCGGKYGTMFYLIASHLEGGGEGGAGGEEGEGGDRDKEKNIDRE